MKIPDFSNKKIILASASPRRKQLLEGLGLNFELAKVDFDEEFPPALQREEIPLFLAREKASRYAFPLNDNSILITADTIVWVDGHVMNKPADHAEAFRMLRTLSGKMHEVFTGVCIRTPESEKSFYAVTNVYFKHLTDEEINWYISQYQPYDKAGAYGAQEWIGYIAIEKIEGSYFNVMGLPVKELWEEITTI